MVFSHPGAIAPGPAQFVAEVLAHLTRVLHGGQQLPAHVPLTTNPTGAITPQQSGALIGALATTFAPPKPRTQRISQPHRSVVAPLGQCLARTMATLGAGSACPNCWRPISGVEISVKKLRSARPPLFGTSTPSCADAQSAKSPGRICRCISKPSWHARGG